MTVQRQAPARHTGIILGRCDPYGAESGGPARVLGGLYGARSAETPGMDLPDNVAQGEWSCPQVAAVRAIMICRCDHRGQPMDLCSWHDEDNWVGQRTSIGFARVRQTIRVRGHFEEIQRRQAGLCPRCSFPSVPGVEDYAALHKAMLVWQGELAQLAHARQWGSPEAHRIRAALEGATARFTEGAERGLIHVCPMILKAVS